MKAIKVINPGANSTLEIQDIPTPEPATDEILIKIGATALNRADLHQRAGKYPPPEGASEILGLEAAGVVEEAGTNVTKWKTGDGVFGLLPGGGYAEYCIMPEKMAMPIPENLSFKEAAAIPETFLTAFQSLIWIGELQRAETVLIHAGGSGVGTAAIQLARHLINARIITTAGTEQKLETCRELGADYTFNYKNQNFAEEINRTLGKNSVDLIIDFIGAPYWEKNIDVIKTDGRIVYLSFLGGHRIENINLAPILKKRLKIMGSTLRNRTESYKINLVQDFTNHTRSLFEEEVLKPIIDKEFDWKETDKAHQYMQDDKNTGKIVLTGM
ncbi:MAG: NAD(P)H-quinone oxidoreductase [Balneolaceae bacterium]|nr:NAD(P)H-quinone oxidoreductase [Balneolaceae bacterium]